MTDRDKTVKQYNECISAEVAALDAMEKAAVAAGITDVTTSPPLRTYFLPDGTAYTVPADHILLPEDDE